MRHEPDYAYQPVMTGTTNSGARERIETDAQATALIHKMRAGERRATALVITELERLSTAAPILLRAMQPYLGHALVIGFTGPPGGATPIMRSK